MRFRFGLLVGGATGYYFGAKAGRERYQQLNEWLQGLMGSEVMETAEEKTKAVIDLGVERARGMVEDRRQGEGTDIDARRGADDPVTTV